MTSIIHYSGLDVHKDSIAVSIAPAKSIEVCRNRPLSRSAAVSSSPAAAYRKVPTAWC
ncbi:MAG: hypothetical protein ACTHLW_01010 [Verrucomicrobiota bacterium]